MGYACGCALESPEALTCTIFFLVKGISKLFQGNFKMNVFSLQYFVRKYVQSILQIPSLKCEISHLHASVSDDDVKNRKSGMEKSHIFPHIILLMNKIRGFMDFI